MYGSLRGLGSLGTSWQDFETMRPGEWTAAGVDPNLTVAPSEWNPTLSTDPGMIAQVNQMLANGTNPVTGRLTALASAALSKGYGWGSGNLVNPYTQQVVGNAWDLGLSGVQSLPPVFNYQEAWEQFDVYAGSKGYSIGADGSIQNHDTLERLRIGFPSYDELAAGGRAVAERARAILEDLPLTATVASGGVAPEAPPALPPPPAPSQGADQTAPAAVTSPPGGWRPTGDGTGWWGPDGLFYPGEEPWASGVAGQSVTTFREEAPTPAPPNGFYPAPGGGFVEPSPTPVLRPSVRPTLPAGPTDDYFGEIGGAAPPPAPVPVRRREIPVGVKLTLGAIAAYLLYRVWRGGK
mgnify:CR=1 FL=1